MMPDPTTPTPSRIATMVVEDDAALREILASWLSEADGFACDGTYPNVERANPHILRHAPDVVLVDINLPGLNGVECVRMLKPHLPKTQFVMFTVYEDSHHIFDALAAGATGYLVKSTPRDALITALQEVYAGGSPMSSNIARKVVQTFQSTPASKPKPNPTATLSKRENEVLLMLAQGYLYKEIADALNLSFQTVNTYIRRIYEKLHVNSRAQAVAVFANIPTESERPTE